MNATEELDRLSRALARILRIPVGELASCLVSACEADLPALLALRQEVIAADLRWDDAAYLGWRYRLDGARADAPFSPGVTRLWLFKRGDAVLGTLGAEDVEITSPAGTVRALRFMDLMAAPHVRGLGIGAWLNLALFGRAEASISVGGSDQSIGMIGRLFRRLPDRKVWSLPLRTAPLLRLRGPLARRLAPLAPILDLGLAARRAIAGARHHLPLVLEASAPADGTVDALVGAMTSAGHTLVRRTGPGWRQRFGACTRATYEFRVARLEGEQVAALVIRRRPELVDLVDWLWDPRHPHARHLLVSLFASCAAEAAAHGASRMRAMTYEADCESACRALGMALRPGRQGYAVRAAEPTRELALTQARWFVTFGDSDGD